MGAAVLANYNYRRSRRPSNTSKGGFFFLHFLPNVPNINPDRVRHESKSLLMDRLYNRWSETVQRSMQENQNVRYFERIRPPFELGNFFFLLRERDPLFCFSTPILPILNIIVKRRVIDLYSTTSFVRFPIRRLVRLG